MQGRNHNKKIYKISSKRAEGFRYLGTNLTNQNSIQKEIQTRLKSGNACYHSVQNILSSSLLSRNLKIKICRNIILPVVLYGCETWSLTLREESRFENKVPRRIFGSRRDEVMGVEKTTVEEMNDLYSSPNIVRATKYRRMRWEGRVAPMGDGRGVYKVWWGNLKERGHLGDPGVDGRTTLIWIFKK